MINEAVELKNSNPLIDNSLEGAAMTLLLPLWARAKESCEPNPFLVDEKAVSIVEKLKKDERYRSILDSIDATLDVYIQKSQLIRAKCLDDEVSAYIKTHPHATVVNLGAGFDTTFSRLDNGTIQWYDLDLPEVIALRRKFIPETDRSRCIAKSIEDITWFDDVKDTGNGIIFVACGVLFFLKEQQVQRLFSELATAFPGCEIAFDSMSKMLISMANKTVLKKGGMESGAVMQWGLGSSAQIVKWDRRFRVVEEYPMFSKIRLCESWGRSCIFRMKMINWLHGINILRIKLSGK